MDKLKIYLASNYYNYLLMESYRVQLEHEGYEVVSTWHIDVDLKLDSTIRKKNMSKKNKGTLDDHASRDLYEIDACDIFVMDSSCVTETGGRQVEMGYAMGIGKIIYIIGSAENIFYHLWFVNTCTNFSDMLSKLDEYKSA